MIFNHLSKDVIVEILSSSKRCVVPIELRLFEFMLDKKEILNQLSNEEFEKICDPNNFFEMNKYVEIKKYKKNIHDKYASYNRRFSGLIDVMLSNECLFLNIYYNFLSSEHQQLICQSPLMDYYDLASLNRKQSSLDEIQYKEMMNTKMQTYIDTYIKKPNSLKAICIKSLIQQKKGVLHYYRNK